MSLSTKNIISLLSLKGVGRTAVLCYVKYAERNGVIIQDVEDYRSLISVCHEKEGCRTTVEQISVSDVRNAEIKAEKVIDKSQKLGINIVGYSDESFPLKLKNIVSKKTSTKGKISIKDESPVVLYFKGTDICRLNDMKSVAIIGTREPTSEGKTAGVYLSKQIAKQGINIVGGLALGCDTFGHEGAIEANGMTTAFLAHGLHTIYPKENEHLAEMIVQNGGLLISEYPIGIEPYAPYFVERDRLQSGISDATIVIQTGVVGGTMHAVNATLMNNKLLFAVEYTSNFVMTQEKVLGNRKLIADGKAHPITSRNIQECISMIIGAETMSPEDNTAFVPDEMVSPSVLESAQVENGGSNRSGDDEITQLTLW